jgi:hypothetical protein
MPLRTLHVNLWVDSSFREIKAIDAYNSKITGIKLK